jgi:hypothetical protein
LKARRGFILLSFLTSIFYFHKGFAMSLFFGGEKKEAVLFSPLEGKLTFKGKPAAGARLKLWTAWKDQEGESEYFTADDEGFFFIPEKTIAYKQNPLSQMSIGQTVTVEYNGQEYLIWRGGQIEHTSLRRTRRSTQKSSL